MDRLVPDVRVLIDGAELPPRVIDNMRGIEVELALRIVSQALLELQNPDGTVGDLPCFDPGRELEVQFGYVGKIQSVFKGEIISVEPSFHHEEGQPTVQVRAYDRLHRLRRGRKQRTFLNQKASDVIRLLAQEEGLPATVEDTGPQHEYLLQNNVTNLELLTELIRIYGFEAFVELGRFKCRKPAWNQGPSLRCKWGADLKSFYTRHSSANVPTQVTVRGWDVAKKQPVIEPARAVEGKLSASRSAPGEVQSAFGAAEVQVSARPVQMAAEAGKMAGALFNEAALRAVDARGSVLGDPAWKPGLVAAVEGVGSHWSGDYYLVRVTHLYHADGGGYATLFEGQRTGTR